jgi:hypothetical protein
VQLTKKITIQAINVVLFVLEVVTAGLYISSDATTNIATAASILSCLAAVALAVFMFFEHRYALESSPIVSLYLFITMLLDAASARSYFLRKTTGLYTIACLTAAVAATKLLLLVAEEVPKRYRIPQEKVGPDTKSGFWARTFLVWMNSTIFIGFRNTLSVEDLPNLGEKFSSAKLAAAFEPRWMKRAFLSPFLVMDAVLTIHREQIIVETHQDHFCVSTMVFSCRRAASSPSYRVQIRRPVSHEAHPSASKRQR